MIRLTKGDVPEILVQKAAEWTQEYKDFKDGVVGIPKAAETRYRNKAIKAAVIRDSFGKCIYCESKIRHAQPGHVEHIKPKSLFEDDVCCWDNLALVCHECNQRKGNKYFVDNGRRLLNPYVEDPGDFIIFAGPLPLPKSGSTRGHVTIIEIGLDRLELVERRINRINAAYRWLALAEVEADENVKEWYKAQAIGESGEEKEYSAAIRGLLELYAKPAAQP